MECVRPLAASLDKTGSITFSSKTAMKGTEIYSFSCGACLPCRLKKAREKAIRATHEAQTHKDNIFLTLTYNDHHLDNPRLNYEHFQDFIRDLRYKIHAKYAKENNTTLKNARQLHPIPYMVTGEYGEQDKRPHWHALLFNYWPEDYKYLKINKLGDKFYRSEEIEDIWQKGYISFSDVNFKTAGYMARYAAKKLVHGNDGTHDFEPIHKTSSRHAIGRKWIERNYKHTFQNGYVVIDGKKLSIPRYYKDWLQKKSIEEPQKYEELYFYYKFEVQPKIDKQNEEKARKEELTYLSQLMNRDHTKQGKNRALHPKTIKHRILKKKFEQLQSNLEL